MLDIPEEYINLASKAGELFVKFFGVIITAYGLKEIWTHQQQKKLDFGLKVNLSILYVLHVGAISLAAAVLFGVEIVTLPIATAIVSGTTLLKNAFDWIKDNHNIYLLNKALKKEQTKLEFYYAVFKRDLDQFIEANQSILMKAFQFIENKYSRLTSFVKNINGRKKDNPEEQIKEINEISKLLGKQKDVDPQDISVLEKDLEQIVATSKSVIDLQNKIALTTHDVKNTRYNTHYSGATASVSLLLCYPSNWLAASTLNPLMLGIGIASALTSVWGLYKKHIAQDQLLANENKEIHRLIEDSVATVDKIKHPEVRTTLTQKFDTIIEEFDNNKPEPQRVLPVIFSAPANKNADDEQKPLSHFVKMRRNSMSDLQEGAKQKSFMQMLRLTS